MSKWVKLLLIATAVLAVIFVVAAYFSSSKKVATSEDAETTRVDQAVLEAEYKTKAKIILDEFTATAQAEPVSIEKIQQEKKDLLALTVPAKLRDFHVGLVLAMDKMINFVETGDVAAKQAALEMVAGVKTGQDWLN